MPLSSYSASIYGEATMSVMFWTFGNLKTSHARQITIPQKSLRIFCSFLTVWLTTTSLVYAQNGKPAEDPGGETSPGGGTIYYVSSSQGKDSNHGRSRETPWSTLSKVTKTSFKPGDTILFKRGDVWKGQVWVFRMMTLACSRATFLRLFYESACNARGSRSTKRQ